MAGAKSTAAMMRATMGPSSKAQRKRWTQSSQSPQRTARYVFGGRREAAARADSGRDTNQPASDLRQRGGSQLLVRVSSRSARARRPAWQAGPPNTASARVYSLRPRDSVVFSFSWPARLSCFRGESSCSGKRMWSWTSSCSGRPAWSCRVSCFARDAPRREARRSETGSWSAGRQRAL